MYSLGAFVLIGILAQMVDGSLGMAYGVTSNSFLLSMGLPPAVSSACVHIAEVFTTLVSGLCHLRFGNVDRDMVKRLLLPGIAGALIGVAVLVSVPMQMLKPYVAVYLCLMGIRILYRAVCGASDRIHMEKGWKALGFVGGFLDAVGGGGWGPVVTSTLVSNGHDVRKTVGSVNFAEFFVTLAQAIAFVALLGLVQWQAMVGLIVGGVVAAPFAALLCKRIPARLLMLIVGMLIIGLSTRTFVLAVL